MTIPGQEPGPLRWAAVEAGKWALGSVRDADRTVMPSELVSQDGSGDHRQELSIVASSTRVRLLSPVVPPDGLLHGWVIPSGWKGTVHGRSARAVRGVGHRQEGTEGLRAQPEPAAEEQPPPGDPHVRHDHQRVAGVAGLAGLRAGHPRGARGNGRLLAGAFYLLEDVLNVILVNAAHAK